MRKDADAGPLDPRGCCSWDSQKKRPGGGTGPGQPEHARIVKPRRRWPLTQMMMVCEVGRQKDAVPGPLERRGFWFLKDPDKKTKGCLFGVIQAHHHAKQGGMGPRTHMMMVREDDSQKGLDAGPLEP